MKHDFGGKICLISFIFCLHFWSSIAVGSSCPALKDGQSFPVVCNYTANLDASVFLEWTVDRYQDGPVLAANCSVSSKTCIGMFKAVLDFNGSFINSTLTIPRASTNYKNFYCYLHPSNIGRWSACSSDVVVYRTPENVTCDPPTQIGPTVNVTCRTPKVSPGLKCLFFSTWSGDWVSRVVTGAVNYEEKVYFVSVDNDTLPYNNSSCTLAAPITSFLAGSHTISVIMSSSADVSQMSSVNISAGLVTFETNVTSFTANGISKNMDTSGGSSVTFDCVVGPVPATNITLLRRMRNIEVSSANKSMRLSYTLENFNCDNVDDYVCQSSGLTSSNQSVTVSTYCPPKLLTENIEIPLNLVESGQSSYFSFQASGWPQKYTFSLEFVESGATYRARLDLYTAHFQPVTSFQGLVNLALYQIKDSDFRDYQLVISNGEGEPLKVILGIRKQPANDKRLDLGLGVGLSLGLVLVAVVIGVVCWRRRRGGGQIKAPDDLKYDCLDKADLGRSHTYRAASADVDQKFPDISMRNEVDLTTSPQKSGTSKGLDARESTGKPRSQDVSVSVARQETTPEVYSNDDNNKTQVGKDDKMEVDNESETYFGNDIKTEFGESVDNIYENYG